MFTSRVFNHETLRMMNELKGSEHPRVYESSQENLHTALQKLVVHLRRGFMMMQLQHGNEGVTPRHNAACKRPILLGSSLTLPMQAADEATIEFQSMRIGAKTNTDSVESEDASVRLSCPWRWCPSRGWANTTT